MKLSLSVEIDKVKNGTNVVEKNKQTKSGEKRQCIPRIQTVKEELFLKYASNVLYIFLGTADVF